MFSHETPIDSSAEEGVITEVDSKRKLCKVKTLSGKSLSNVRWLAPTGGASRGGVRFIPTTGESVYVDYRLGNPVIVGFLPKVQSSEENYSVGIDTNEELVDPVNFGINGATAKLDKNQPKDLVSGDQVMTTIGGGIIAALRGGSVLLRSSRFAEIFMSKYGDLVRIVSRNFDHFTDVSTTTYRNLRGRIYKYVGYSNNFAQSKNEGYTYHEYRGDVPMAQAARSKYSNYSGSPASNDVIAKEQVTNQDSTSSFMEREVHLDGTVDVVVKNGGTFTRVRQKSGEVYLSQNDTNFVKIDPSHLEVNYGGVNIINVSSGSITLSKGGDPVLTLTSAGVFATYGGHSISIDSSGVHLN